jgi:NRPS condensation-like uncharacterized protein
MTAMIEGYTTTAGVVAFNYLDDFITVLDAPEQPMSVHLELVVEGRLDAEQLRWALKEAARRHPLAQARVLPADDSDRQWFFQIDGHYTVDPLSEMDCSDEGEIDAARDRLFNTLVPSDEAPLFRALLVHHRAGDRLILNLHHIAGDGIGTVRFLRSVQRAYAGEDDPPPHIDLMPARDLEHLLGIADLDERRRREEPRRRYLEELARDVPTRLVPEGAEPSGGQGIVNLRLTPEEAGIVRRRRRPGTTLNAVLVTAHQLAYQEWNRRHGAEPGRIGTMGSRAVSSWPRHWGCRPERKSDS